MYYSSRNRIKALNARLQSYSLFLDELKKEEKEDTKNFSGIIVTTNENVSDNCKKIEKSNVKTSVNLNQKMSTYLRNINTNTVYLKDKTQNIWGKFCSFFVPFTDAYKYRNEIGKNLHKAEKTLSKIIKRV